MVLEDPEVLNRFAGAFFDSVLTDDEDVPDYILHPRAIDKEVLVYAAMHDNAWGGAVVNDLDVWRSPRLSAARELWTFVQLTADGGGAHRLGAGIYVVDLWERDRILCTWKKRRSAWLWTAGALQETPTVPRKVL